MPELVNSRVGSSPGTRGLLGTISWPRSRKYSRKVLLSSLLFNLVAVRADGCPAPTGSGDIAPGASRDGTAAHLRPSTLRPVRCRAVRPAGPGANAPGWRPGVAAPRAPLLPDPSLAAPCVRRGRDHCPGGGGPSADRICSGVNPRRSRKRAWRAHSRESAGIAAPKRLMRSRDARSDQNPGSRSMASPGRLGADAALPQLLADAPRAVAPAGSRADVLLGEPLLAQESLRLQGIEHPLDRHRVAAPRGELERELSTCVLAACEQFQRPRPELRIVIADQAPTASPASARFTEPLRFGRSMSRSVASIARATSSCSLRNSRTLSRPWPIRSPL